MLYGQNSLGLQDIYSLAPFERQGMIDVFNEYTEEINKEIESRK
jgi:hypothetical protein